MRALRDGHLPTPFTGTPWHLVHQHLNEQPAPLRTLRTDAPAELQQLVGRLLAKDPAHRPNSADEVYDLIEEINDRYFKGTPPPSCGADLTSEVSLSKDEAAHGAVIPLRITTRQACPDCATTDDETKVLNCLTRSASPPAKTGRRFGSRNSAHRDSPAERPEICT
ncbi:hypothetical protein [Streptomyces sp. NPDC017095]|uniref:hypothetical protein n=1 Tax=Streptomyces sp. NPDC017095 TaxID=3364977 RepID=UPI003789F124